MAKRSQRKDIAFVLLVDLIPNEATAQHKFENIRFPDSKLSSPGFQCLSVQAPFDAFPLLSFKQYFSLRTGTTMQSSKLPLRTDLWAMFLEVISPKGILAAQLWRLLGISRPTAWFSYTESGQVSDRI